jgi:uncharacterized protein
VVYLPVVHEGNAARSSEEADLVAELIRELLGCDWIDPHGRRRRLTPRDILVVAPYNAHVAEIAGRVRTRLEIEASVGTVDKFQGQEGAVVLYAMATSSAQDAPRTMDFLYSRSRLNVATSRGRCLAVLLCSPELLLAHCRRPEDLRMLSAFCRLVEMSSGSSAPLVEREVRVPAGAGRARRGHPAQASFAWPAADLAGTGARQGK